MRKILLSFMQPLLLTLVVSSAVVAQTGSVKGIIWDSESSDVVTGANVLLKGTSTGTITGADGSFLLENIPAGNQTIVISFIGFASKEVSVKVNVGTTTDLGQISMESQAMGLQEINVIASVAIDRKTPVAVSTIKGSAIEAKVGNLEFPEMLRSTPSVYVTKQGGGFGDSRINIRGFDQRNTAVMINGIPVNDMENGWVYWSNWAGLTDVTSSMQVQRGLGASKLAVSSVGGSINIVTNAALMEKGGSVQASFGNDGYMKYGLMYSTGLSEKGWAFTAQSTHTQGDGYADGTKFNAWSYFASIAKQINTKHSIHLTALGAPQWHNQRNYGNFDGITYDTLQARGIKFNPQWGIKNGEEFSWNKNFYHKPKVFLNHYWTISEKTEVATSAYASFGRGGGTGDLGKINDRFRTDARFRNRNTDGTVRWGDIVNWNQGGTVSDFDRTVRNSDGDITQVLQGKQPWSNGGGFDGQYVGTAAYSFIRLPDGTPFYTDLTQGGFIRRSSVNSHNWLGVLSTLTHQINDNFTFTGGLDARYYKGIHYRRLEDLLGLAAYFDDDDINNPVKYVTNEGSDADKDKIDYYNDGLVRWIGLFGQMEYSIGDLSTFVSGSFSNQSFKRIDYFLYTPDEQESDWESFMGGTVKVGANYNINSKHNVFMNGGYFSQQPLFDNVFLNFSNTVNEDAKNQKVYSFELGYGYRSTHAAVNVNLYNTTWTDRQLSKTVQVDGADGTANFFDIGQLHQGVEVDLNVSPLPKLTLTGMASLGNWRYTKNFTASVLDENQSFLQDLTLYVKDVKIPDAAQTTFSFGADYEIIRALRIYASYYYADRVHADFAIDDNSLTTAPSAGETNQAWQLPAYSLVDAGISYGFKIGKVQMIARVNINNVLDEEYISESETNRLFNANTETTTIGDNGSPTNIVYYGFGRTWNAGLKARF